MSVIFSPSLMCADYSCLEQELALLEEAGADRFHLDLMDGQFVPNFAMGLEDIRCVCRHAHIPTELHLMIRMPCQYIQMFAEAGVDFMYVHPESDYHPATVLQRIAEAGVQPGIVLSPGTSIESVTELLRITKHVLVMGVNPGHAGQIYLPYIDQKIERLLELKERLGLEISIDGACNRPRIAKWSAKGVSGFVLGTAALFGQPGTYQEIFASLRQAVKGGSK